MVESLIKYEFCIILILFLAMKSYLGCPKEVYNCMLSCPKKIRNWFRPTRMQDSEESIQALWKYMFLLANGNMCWIVLTNRGGQSYGTPGSCGFQVSQTPGNRESRCPGHQGFVLYTIFLNFKPTCLHLGHQGFVNPWCPGVGNLWCPGRQRVKNPRCPGHRGVVF